MAKLHYYWIDWMKTIGMYFIVAGHLNPVGYTYIYVFSVPLFFIISGFLAKHEKNRNMFWQKQWTNLILPCIVICLLMHIHDIMLGVVHGNFSWEDIPKHIFYCIIGEHGLGTGSGGLGMCWFIYTLVLCRILYQYTFDKIVLRWLVVIVCLVVAIMYNRQEIEVYNAVLNTSLAYPLYLFGGGGKFLYDNMRHPVAKTLIIVLFVISLTLVAVIGKLNGAPWMFGARYGNNLILFLIGGIAGTLAVFACSYLFQRFHCRGIDVISRGTIIVLGFQFVLIECYSHAPELFHGGLSEYVAAFIILVSFLPLINFSEIYFPVLLGTRVLNRNESINQL